MISIFWFLSENAGLHTHQRGTFVPPSPNYFIFIAVVMSVGASLLHLLTIERWLIPHLADLADL